MELSRNDLVSVLQEPLAAMHESLNQQRDAQARRRIPPFLAGTHLNLSPFSWHVPVTVFPSFPVNSQASSAALSTHAACLQIQCRKHTPARITTVRTLSSVENPEFHSPT